MLGYVAAAGKQAGLEGATEAATTVSQNMANRMAYEKRLNPDMDMNEWWKQTGKDAAYSALLGAIVGGTMGAPAAIHGERVRQLNSELTNAVQGAQTVQGEQQQSNQTLAGNEEQQNNSWKSRYYVNGDKAYLYSRDLQRAYEIPAKNELNYAVDTNGGVKLNTALAPELDAADYKDFAKAYAAKNLITEFDNNNNMVEPRPIKIADDGQQVIVTQAGIKDVLKNVRGNRKSAALLDSIFVLDDIIAGARKVSESENTKGRVNPFSYYKNTFTDSRGQAYDVTIDIKNTPDMGRYHYHGLQEAQIKIEPLDPTSSDSNSTAGAEVIARNSNTYNIPNGNNYVKPVANGQNNALQAAKAVQGEQSMPQAERNGEGAENQTLAGNVEQSVQPVKVGKVTVIQKPYTGATPENISAPDGQATARPVIQPAALQNAQEIIAEAREDEHFAGFIRATLRSMFRQGGGSRPVGILNVRFEGAPYEAMVNDSLTKKLAGDHNMTPEKLAVFGQLDEVLAGAKFVGSGEYNKKNIGKAESVIRYDYFENEVNIGGTPYVAAFDVEVYKTANNLRTYKVINEMSLQPLTATPAAYADAPNGTSSSVNNIIPSPAQNSNPNLPENSAQTAAPAEQVVAKNETTTSPMEQRQTAEADLQTARTLCEKLGVELRIAELPEGVEGHYENGVITIAPNTENPVRQVFIHELTHHLEASGKYEAYKNFVLAEYTRANGQNGQNALRAYIKSTIEDYAEFGQQLSEDGAIREVVAEMSEKLLGDEAMIDRLAAYDGNLFQRIYRWLKDMAVKLGGTQEQKTAAEAVRRFEKALRATVAKNETVQTGQSENGQYKIRRDINGEKFVDVDRDILTDKKSPKITIEKVGTNEEDNFTYNSYKIYRDGEAIGDIGVMLDDNYAYCERIDIDEEYQNNGYGTKALKAIVDEYGDVVVAPDNADAQRLYERLGSEWNGDDAGYIDQGFGVYILDNIPSDISSWESSVKPSIKDILADIIQNKFHNLIEVNGQRIGINRDTGREWRYSNEASRLYDKNINAFNDKIRALNNADELLAAAKDWVGEKPKHNNFKEFARGKVAFRVGENGYSADVVVGITDRGNSKLYDIVNIKSKEITEAPETKTPLQTEVLDRADASVTDSISNHEEKSNPGGQNSLKINKEERHSRAKKQAEQNREEERKLRDMEIADEAEDALNEAKSKITEQDIKENVLAA